MASLPYWNNKGSPNRDTLHHRTHGNTTPSHRPRSASGEQYKRIEDGTISSPPRNRRTRTNKLMVPSSPIRTTIIRRPTATSTNRKRWTRGIQCVGLALVAGYLLLLWFGTKMLPIPQSHDLLSRASFLHPAGRLYMLRERLEQKRMERKVQAVSSQAQRATARAERTKPLADPIIDTAYHAPERIPYSPGSGQHVELMLPAMVEDLCGTHARNASLLDPTSFPEAFALNEESRVLITGILNPVGLHLALALHQLCGVQVIGGIDPIFPNQVAHRMEMQKRIQLLTTSIPKLVSPIIQPLIGLDPRPSKSTASNEWIAATAEQSLMIMNPTHIVHLATYSPTEHEDFGEVIWRNLQSPYIGEEANVTADLFGIRSSLTSMEQILASLTQQLPDDRPHMVYAASTKFDQLLADTYSVHHDVYSVGLTLPDIVYGPWGRRNTPMHTLMEQVATGVYNESAGFPEMQRPVDLSHVSDVVDGIIASMQFRNPQHRRLDLSSGQESTLAQIHNVVDSYMSNKTLSVDTPAVSSTTSPLAQQTRQLLQWEPSIPIRTGLAKTLAWYIDHAFPFGRKSPGSETGDAMLQRLGDVETCAPEDVLCHMDRKYLPCLSECSVRDQCVPSMFDDVRDLILEVSSECDIVLYTQSVGYNVRDLRLQATYKDEGDILICNIAFVPEQSRLAVAAVDKVPEEQLQSFGVNSTLDEMYAQDPDVLAKQKMNALNGRLLYKGWILIWLPNAQKALHSYDHFLAKLSPGALFSSDVKHAVFVDETFPVSPNNDDVQFLVGQTHRPALPDRKAWRKNKENGKKIKYLLEAEPERTATILVSPLKHNKLTETGQPVKITIYEATKYMQVEIGKKIEDKETTSVKREREFYERIPTFVNRLDFRSVNEPWYKYELKHWIRSRWIVHDLQLEEGRQLRCDWYQEHVQWGNRLDQLSFAHIMAVREMERRIDYNEPDDHAKPHWYEHPELLFLSDSHEWHSLQSEENRLQHQLHDDKFSIVADHLTDLDEQEAAIESNGLVHNVQVPARHERDVPLFVRIVSEGIMMQARQAWANEHGVARK